MGNNDTRLKTGRKGGEFSLQIDHVALEDRALYACIIANNHGKVHSSTEVFVKSEFLLVITFCVQYFENIKAFFQLFELILFYSHL